MPGRSYIGNAYRYGFNGKEKDDEVKGNGAQYDYGFRIFDPRIGRFLSVDPLTMSYPFYTPYQFAGNKPIWAVDLDGLEEFYVTHWTSEGTHYSKIQVTVANRGAGLGTQYQDGKYTDADHRVQYTDRNTGKVTYQADLSASERAAVQAAFVRAADDTGQVPAGSYEITSTEPAPPAPKTVEPATTAHPPTTTTTTPVTASTPSGPTSTPPTPGGFSLGDATTAAPLKGYAEANKKVADWLISNPDFNLSITTGAGIPKGEGLSDDITWTDFESKTYQDRTNEFIGKWKTDIVKASGGKVGADRINVTVGDPNSYSIKVDAKKK